MRVFYLYAYVLGCVCMCARCPIVCVRICICTVCVCFHSSSTMLFIRAYTSTLYCAPFLSFISFLTYTTFYSLFIHSTMLLIQSTCVTIVFLCFIYSTHISCVSLFLALCARVCRVVVGMMRSAHRVFCVWYTFFSLSFFVLYMRAYGLHVSVYVSPLSPVCCSCWSSAFAYSL
jgi:hypothetical protein